MTILSFFVGLLLGSVLGCFGILLVMANNLDHADRVKERPR